MIPSGNNSPPAAQTTPLANYIVVDKITNYTSTTLTI